MEFKKGFLVLIGVFLFQTAYIESKEIKVEKDKSFFWSINSGASTVYLLGSIHFFKKEYYPLKPVIENAFKASSSLVVEVDIGSVNPIEMQKKIMLEGMYVGEDSIEKNVSKEVLGLLKKYLEKRKIPFYSMSRFKPGMLSITLTTVELMKLGFSPNDGIDFYFINKAKKQNKEILELETFDEQLKLIFNLPDQDLFLKHTIFEMAKMEEMMEDLINLWETGDVNGFHKLMFADPLKQHPEFLPIYKKMFYDRNTEMAKKIESFLKTKRSYFVVIGSGHLTGDKGVIEILKKLKYDVNQL